MHIMDTLMDIISLDYILVIMDIPTDMDIILLYQLLYQLLLWRPNQWKKAKLRSLDILDITHIMDTPTTLATSWVKDQLTLNPQLMLSQLLMLILQSTSNLVLMGTTMFW